MAGAERHGGNAPRAGSLRKAARPRCIATASTCEQPAARARRLDARAAAEFRRWATLLCSRRNRSGHAARGTARPRLDLDQRTVPLGPSRSWAPHCARPHALGRPQAGASIEPGQCRYRRHVRQPVDSRDLQRRPGRADRVLHADSIHHVLYRAHATRSAAVNSYRFEELVKHRPARSRVSPTPRRALPARLRTPACRQAAAGAPRTRTTAPALGARLAAELERLAIELPNSPSASANLGADRRRPTHRILDRRGFERELGRASPTSNATTQRRADLHRSDDFKPVIDSLLASPRAIPSSRSVSAVLVRIVARPT